ncbi:DUF262 domain-containing HNH endonuclease family protein [Sphingobacterium bambusae]|uniref:DUF262 domain-containing HNH endonuclease family protein n=1 Tax=Sphingobacterium bambusae TaxID=662858 RepID=A0ABW6BNB4_9SPHI|nr:DUF262 domain-containing HNH endonuclease family protein [Sphingobacterium bambusae]WPL47911.1 DUF262 domain-containing HNH endonuclease family protein [Sphingobacterium bambusae]
MINIDKAFNTENRSIYEYFVQPGVGFYIPLYQREYSWDTSNIEQLLEDIAKGIEDLSDDSTENQIRFLGTIITVTESDKNNVQPQDTKALPPAIEKVIDGQQRLSTITLISALLYKQITVIEERLEKASKKLDEQYNGAEILSEISEACKDWKKKLQAVFGVDLNRGTPSIKPKIIRGNIDKWVMREQQNESYLSQISGYLYAFIEHFFNNGEMPTFDKQSNAGRNLKEVNIWLNKHVALAHLDSSEFCDAQTIFSKIDEDNLWQYKRPILKEILETGDITDKNTFSYHLSSLVQTFSVCHYLLDRCCFTIIKPANDDWAFDMFQSLNATGTPLTAIETFKPVVVQAVPNFKEASENEYFTKIEKAFENLSSAAQKSKLTNELLTSFALPVEGRRLATHFSAQRKWLGAIYGQLDSIAKKTEFIKYFGNYTEFYDDVWNKYKGKDKMPPSILAGTAEADLTSLLLLFLKESNHKMAITFLGTFYNDLVEGKENSASKFVSIVKAVSAFYLIWRAHQSNSGLDDVYRTYFRGSTKIAIESHTWLTNPNFEVGSIKSYLRDKLPKEKADWLATATINCTYSSSYSVCKFALFNAAHDTIPDDANPGLFKKSTAGKSDYLRLERWISEELDSIEHIAPKVNKGDWMPSIYSENDLFDKLGNLTLLPRGVNTSASNKGWDEKLIYYKHLGEQDPDRLVELTNKAKADNIPLKDSNLEILKRAKYADHIRPLLNIPENHQWNDEIIIERSRKILDTLWDRVIGWLE